MFPAGDITRSGAHCSISILLVFFGERANSQGANTHSRDRLEAYATLWPYHAKWAKLQRA